MNHLVILMADNAAPAAVVVTDDFNRANSTTSLGTATTGQVWISARGTWGISANQAYNPVPDVADRSVAVVESGLANGTVQVAIFPVGYNEGVTFRYVDVDNWLAVAVIVDSLNLYKRVAGVNSKVLLASTSTVTYPSLLRVEFTGTAIVVKIDGVQKATATVTEFTTATKHGLFTDAIAGIDSGIAFDNFSVTA